MTQFSLVQASVAQPFFDAAPLPLTKLERMAQDAGLPGSIVTQPTGIVSLHAAERCMVRLERRIKHPTYFVETVCSPSSPHDTSVANIAMPRALTGVEAIERIAETISSFIYGADFLTQTDGNRIWLLRTAGTTDWTDRWPVQQYNLQVGWQAVQNVIGRPVAPRALRLSSVVPKAALPEPWRDLPVVLSKRKMGMAFDIADLNSTSDSALVGGWSSRETVHPQIQEVHLLRACLEGFLSETDQESLSSRMAKTFGMSTRSYRRRLERLGLTHR
ncbi:MAG: hypothetical protein AAF922_12710 [Pseudomonadota bacterium]